MFLIYKDNFWVHYDTYIDQIALEEHEDVRAELLIYKAYCEVTYPHATTVPEGP